MLYFSKHIVLSRALNRLIILKKAAYTSPIPLNRRPKNNQTKKPVTIRLNKEYQYGKR